MSHNRDWTTNGGPYGWMRYAACRDRDPATFFPDTRGRNGGRTAKAEAVAVCAQCPVRGACLEYATTTDITDGVWGGEFFHRDYFDRRVR